MKNSSVLDQLYLNFGSLDVIIGNKSALDSNTFLGKVKNAKEVSHFLMGYGVDLTDPVESAELFGHFQEALEFIRKFFLKEGDADDGLDYQIPQEITHISDISKLFLLSTEGIKKKEKIELSIWAGIILKLMHTILHVDKDLRQNYFNQIQTQIFDRYYKYLHRDNKNKLFLRSTRLDDQFEIEEFQTKAKKTRESVVIKLLHKKENVAEELFDRIGIRIITKTKYDCLRTIKFLQNNNVIMPHNVKPSRSHNSLLDLEKFKEGYQDVCSQVLGENLKYQEAIDRLNALANSSLSNNATRPRNKHTLDEYRAFHFTCRQLVKYEDPLYSQLIKLRKEARKGDSPLAQMVKQLDTSSLSINYRFFYPYEVQITDKESHARNSQGEASHGEYKKSQLFSARERLFRPLTKFYEKNKPNQ